MCGVLFSGTQTDSIPRCFDLSTTRIMLLGDAHTGKTSLTLRFVKGYYYPDVETNGHVEDIYHRRVNLRTFLKNYRGKRNSTAFNRIWDGCNGFKRDSSDTLYSNFEARRYASMDIQLLDSSSLDPADFSDLRDGQIAQADAFVIFFDPTNSESLYNVRNYQRRIEQIRGIDDPVPILVASAKCDLISDEQVPRQEIYDFLRTCELSYEDDYIQISARDDINVDELFIRVLLKVEDYKYHERLMLQENSNSSIEPSVPVATRPVTKTVSYPVRTSPVPPARPKRRMSVVGSSGLITPTTQSSTISNNTNANANASTRKHDSSSMSLATRSETLCVAEVLRKKNGAGTPRSMVSTISSRASATPVLLRSQTSRWLLDLLAGEVSLLDMIKVRVLYVENFCKGKANCV